MPACIETFSVCKCSYKYAFENDVIRSCRVIVVAMIQNAANTSDYYQHAIIGVHTSTKLVASIDIEYNTKSGTVRLYERAYIWMINVWFKRQPFKMIPLSKMYKYEIKLSITNMHFI